MTPISVPPGSCVSTTFNPRSRSLFVKSCICVVLPQPSVPSKVMNVPRRSVIDKVKNLLEIFPGFFLGVLIIRTQKIRRMISDHHRNITPPVPVSAQFGDAIFRSQNCFGRSGSEGTDRFRPNDGQ